MAGPMGADWSLGPYRPTLAIAQNLGKEYGAKEKGPEVKAVFPWLTVLCFHAGSLKDTPTILSPSSVIFLNIIERPPNVPQHPKRGGGEHLPVEGVSREYR